MSNDYCVYILTNAQYTVLNTGVTNDLERRLAAHAGHVVPGFTDRYNVNKLVYYEATSDIDAAIAREDRIKGWRRSKQVALIESQNPGWRDLSPTLPGPSTGSG